MPWKIRYQMSIDWVGPGAGPMEALSPAAGIGLQMSGSGSQTKTFVGNPALIPIAVGGVAGPPAQLNGTDVTNLTNAMAADMAAQLNANLATPNGWATGQP